MRVVQIKVEYRPEEDRLLLFVAMAAGEELRLWLTRRLVQRLWPLLQKLLRDASPQVRSQATLEAQRAVLGFERDAALQQADFSRPYRAPRASLLPEPVLVTRVRAGRNADGRPVLALHPPSGAGVTLALDRITLHAMCQLLAGGVRKADWNLGLELPGAGLPAGTEDAHAVN